MENPEEILVIILSSFLAIFLVLNSIFLVLAIKIALTVKRVTDKAEKLADKAEAFSEYVQSAATPMIIGKLFSSVSDTFFNRSGKSKSK